MRPRHVRPRLGDRPPRNPGRFPGVGGSTPAAAGSRWGLRAASRGWTRKLSWRNGSVASMRVGKTTAGEEFPPTRHPGRSRFGKNMTRRNGDDLYDPRNGDPAIRTQRLDLVRKPFEPARTNYFSVYLTEAGSGTFWADA